MHARSSVLAGSAWTLLLCGTMSLLAAEPAGQTGDLWEVTTRMSMEGMPMEMPPQTSRVCAAKAWKEPPGGRPDCKSTDFRQTGNKVTWKAVCSGPPPMTGEGEIVRESDSAYTGSIKFNSSEGNMTIKLNGRRLGACEPK
jgi:hypothetical protein